MFAVVEQRHDRKQRFWFGSTSTARVGNGDGWRIAILTATGRADAIFTAGSRSFT